MSQPSFCRVVQKLNGRRPVEIVVALLQLWIEGEAVLEGDPEQPWVYPCGLKVVGLWEFAGWTHRTPELVRVHYATPPTSWGLQHLDPAKSQRAKVVRLPHKS